MRHLSKILIAIASLCVCAPLAHAQLGSISLDDVLTAPVSLDVPGFLNSSNFNVSLGLAMPSVYDMNVVLPDTGSADVYIALSVTNVYVHEGPPDAPASPWRALGPIDSTNTASFLHDSAGALSHTGKTYHISGFYSGRVSVVIAPFPPVASGIAGDIETAFFLDYPFMTNPVLRAYLPEGSNGLLVVEYQDGLYSNRVSVSVPVGQDAAGFYRLYSPDADPTNAVIEFRNSLRGGTWVTP